MNRIGIVSAVRTPIGNFGGSLRTVPAYDLAALVLNEVIKRAGIAPETVDMVVMGQNYQSGEYVNIARMGLLLAGWPVEIPGMTIDRRCPSGADAICLGTMMIQSGNGETIVAGGVESMSTVEFYLKGDMRWSMGGTDDMPRGHGSLSTWSTPLYDRILRARSMSQPISRFGIVTNMMVWAEAAAREYKLSREEVDKWALRSHLRAIAATMEGRFTREIVPVPVPQPKGPPVIFKNDEHPRSDSTPEILARLKPLMDGICTAANSSSENDGAAAVVLMPEGKIQSLGLKPLAFVKAFAFMGTDPCLAYKVTPSAVRAVLNKTGMKIEDIDLIEIHEAFAAQTLANFRELGITEKDYDRINVNGSCVALGHPLGATGARIVTTLVYEMERRDAQHGLIAICGGGGMGVAMILER
ncbi:MAG: thiolase family protein [Dehalococcoidales bacterium]|nr:thiolase family protein [Dehalococcoidales bacterium]